MQRRSAHVNTNKIVVVDKLKEHEYCLRCGRKLKNQDARLLGYGTICYKKSRTDSTKKSLF